MPQQKALYRMFFFGPGETRMRIGEFDSNSPPPTYNPGDIIDASGWDKLNWEPFGGPYFQVRCVEHRLISGLENSQMVESFMLGVYLDNIDTKTYSKLIGAD